MDQYRLARELPHIEILGVDCHIGSQLLKTDPFMEAIKKLGKLIQQLTGLGIQVRYLDLGGGLGITYDREEPPRPRDYARSIMQELGRGPTP